MKITKTSTGWALKDGNISAHILRYGAVIQSLTVMDKNGRPVNVVLGYDDPADYEKGSCFLGAVIGRYAGRIRGSSFTLNGQEYRLPKNEGENHLHGVFHKRVFEAKPLDDALALTLKSPHMEDGFPGNLTLTVKYSLKNGGLTIEYEAVTDKPTVLNLTNHTYFNLAGHGTVHGHVLRLDADRCTENSPDGCPTGQILPVNGTVLDFLAEKPVGDGLDSMPPELRPFGGYDHNLVFSKVAGFLPRGSLYCPETGIEMTIITTQPAVQLYTGNFLPGDAAPQKHSKYSGLCLETQHFPDSPNMKDFPSTALAPGEVYKEKTEYKFKIRR